jgi:hypothetical protein
MSCKYILLGAIISVFLTGCTCREQLKSYVKDSETHEPIQGVTVRTVAALKGNYKEGTTDITDSAGYFVAQYEVNNIAKCPVTKLFISRPGYENAIVIDPQMGDTIFITKIKQ